MKSALPTLLGSAAILAGLGACAAYAQGAQATFEVASVKPAPPPSGGGILTSFSGGPGTGDPENIVARNVSLAELIRLAYEVKPYQVVGPAWLRSTRFDVVAKVAPDTPKAQVPAMWRALLTERFQLAAHNESKDLPVYALVLAKNGPKLKESGKDGPAESSNGGSPKRSVSVSGGSGGDTVQIGAASPREGGGPSGAVPGLHKMSGGGVTASRLADMLAANLDRPVVDETGLTGKYDFVLTYSDDPKPAGDASGAADAPPGASLFASLQQQLGLKLEPRKGPVAMVVVDNAAKVPTGN